MFNIHIMENKYVIEKKACYKCNRNRIEIYFQFFLPMNLPFKSTIGNLKNNVYFIFLKPHLIKTFVCLLTGFFFSKFD